MWEEELYYVYREKDMDDKNKWTNDPNQKMPTRTAVAWIFQRLDELEESLISIQEQANCNRACLLGFPNTAVELKKEETMGILNRIILQLIALQTRAGCIGETLAEVNEQIVR